MSREKQLQQYKKFIENCTTVAKSVSNYTDFKRINECIGLLFPDKKDISILDFDDVFVFQRIVEELQNQDEFVSVNNKGKNQYSNTLKYYLRYLYAKRLFSNKEKTVTKSTIATKDKTPLQTIYYGTPGSGKSHKVKKLIEGINEDFVFRTTFHPDSDYASFVGSYKPNSKNKSLLNGNNYTESQLLTRFFDSKEGDNIKARYLYESLINTVDIRNLNLDANIIAEKLKKIQDERVSVEVENYTNG